RYIYSESNEDVDYNKFYDIPYFEYSKDGEYYCMAFKWWREAASEGDSDSQYCVGMGSRDCLSGSMIEDIWFYRAAVQGDAFALHEFCESMLDEKSKSHKTFKNMDETKILELCKQFAENGDAGAQDMLSRMYLYGFGTEANLDEAKKWSLKAMEHEGYYPYSAYLYGLHKLGLDKY
ncbi:sel1 repeat family protein, partial [bacterium]|nr:sel1 repeat family protein [bacterium]